MKIIKPVAVALLLGLAGVGSAWADHGGHVHFGVVVGGPYWGPWGYPPAYYYPPYYHPYYPPAPIVIERPVPQVYIEQAEPAPAVSVPPASAPASAPAEQAAAAPANDWYYCAGARGYYPYVKECPGGWQRVPAQPPGQR